MTESQTPGHKWRDEDGKVLAAYWNPEYELYVDFVNGILVDMSPNCFRLKVGEYDPENLLEELGGTLDHDKLVESWDLELEGDVEEYAPYYLDDDIVKMTLEEYQAHVAQLYGEEDDD